jgi:hypothetical protein
LPPAKRYERDPSRGEIRNEQPLCLESLTRATLPKLAAPSPRICAKLILDSSIGAVACPNFNTFMTLKLRFVGLAVSAAAASSLLFGATAKAACIGGDTTCGSFDPTTVSTPSLTAGTFGTSGTSAGTDYSHAILYAEVSGFSGSAFNLSAFSLTGNGITSSLAGFGNINISGNGPAFSSSVLLDTSVMTVNFTQSTLSFSIPSGVSPGTSLILRIRYMNNSNPLTASQVATTTVGLQQTASGGSAGVPGPLPLLGAGAAFSFSRKARKRILQSV